MKAEIFPLMSAIKNSCTTVSSSGLVPSSAGNNETRKDNIPSASPQEDVRRESKFIPVAGINMRSCRVEILPSTLTI